MSHKFTPLFGFPNVCIECHKSKSICESNTESTIKTKVEPKGETCECCSNVGKLVKFKTMMMCQECYHKDLEHSSPEAEESRLQAHRKEVAQIIQINEVLRKSEEIDKSISIRTDIFNAETVAINELKQAIEADDSITNKPYELAKVIKARFEKYKEVIWQKNREIEEIGNQQKAVQVYLNTMANTLRAEEREILKIQDINYKPNPVKLTSLTKSGEKKTIKTRSSKVLDKSELEKYSKELGISAATIQMIVVSKGITVEMAAKQIRASIEAMKSQSNQQGN